MTIQTVQDKKEYWEIMSDNASYADRGTKAIIEAVKQDKIRWDEMR